VPATELSLGVTLAVLGAGALHAGWNALLKAAPGGDSLLDTATVVAGSAVCGLIVIPFVGLPDFAAWKRRDLGNYPLGLLRHAGAGVSDGRSVIRLSADARHGAAHHHAARHRVPSRMAGAARRRRYRADLRRHRQHRLLSVTTGTRLRRRRAFANAAIIAAYTLVDGSGARASGNPASYVAWLTFAEAIPFLLWIRVRRGAAAFAYVRRGWRRGLLGGAAGLAAYGIVLWAMTRAPVAAVAALRETSVLFAALIGAVWLKEGFGLPRLAGAASVVAGVAALKL
jgi:drug/metabolite transporter (DMT)-like permease